MIELRIGGRVVDCGPDTKITLEFNSNAFGDISKIVASNSFTINLPKTPTNNNIFGSPAVLGGTSSAPYRRWDAQLYVNGVSVVDAAFAILLSVGEEYEIVLYWGVISALAALKDNDKTIADINEVLYTQYGGAEWWTDWVGVYGMDANGVVSNGLVNALYNPGIDDLRNDATARTQAALLPSVRARWVWDRILADSGLEVVAPSDFLSWLNSLALPFTTHKASASASESNNYATDKFSYTRRGGEAVLCLYGGETIDKGIYSIAPIFTSIKLEGRAYEATTVGFRTTATGRLSAFVHLSFYAGTVIDSAAICFAHYTKEGELNKEYTQSLNYASSTKEGSSRVNIEMSEGDYVVCYVRLFKITGFDKSATERATMTLHKLSFSFDTEGVSNQVMGGMINTRDNLPDIKQVDFIKAMCEMFGLWATLVDGKVHLVNYADYYSNAQPALDWSHKLVGTGDGDAATTTYTLLDFAQRNILRYKDDDSVNIDASGVLYVDNETLENEKDMVELPFAASDGDEIPHLRWKDNDRSTAEVEEESVEQRIMLLYEGMGADGKPNTSLSFVGLSFDALARDRYAYWQRVMRNPIVIEEKVQLSEIDIKTLDFRKPIYLQKYGARFVVDKVQWSEGSPSAVTLIMLPPAKDIATALPYSVTTGVTLGRSMSGASDSIASFEYLVSGAGDYFAESATLYFDEATAKSKHGIAFNAWTSEAGIVLSTDNPFVYDGSNGDMTIYANTTDELIIG